MRELSESPIWQVFFGSLWDVASGSHHIPSLVPINSVDVGSLEFNQPSICRNQHQKPSLGHHSHPPRSGEFLSSDQGPSMEGGQKYVMNSSWFTNPHASAWLKFLILHHGFLYFTMHIYIFSILSYIIHMAVAHKKKTDMDRSAGIHTYGPPVDLWHV